MSNDLKLGELIASEQFRDAVHIAVAPVTADVKLAPGQDVGFVDEGTERVGAAVARLIGIVDPFLKNLVFPGQRFWMFLYPNTITSLRHEWIHPAFGGPVAPDQSKELSEKWLRDFVASADCPDYDTVIAAAVGGPLEVTDDYHTTPYMNDGEYLTFYGRDAHSSIPPEFWDHVEIVTGKKIPQGMRAESFSCSC